MASCKCRRNSRKNSNFNSGRDAEVSECPPKKLTEVEKFRVWIPKTSNIYKFLMMPNQDKNSGRRVPMWKQLEDIVVNGVQTKEDFATQIFEDFVARMGALYPDKVEGFRKLRAFVLWQMLYGETLSDSYYDRLKGLR